MRQNMQFRDKNKNLRCCWDSSCYDNVSDSGRSANPYRNPEYDLRKRVQRQL